MNIAETSSRANSTEILINLVTLSSKLQLRKDITI